MGNNDGKNLICESCGHTWVWKGKTRPRCPKCKKRDVMEHIEVSPPIEPELISEEPKPVSAKEPVTLGVKETRAVLDFSFGLVSRLVGNWVLLDESDHKLIDEPTAKMINKLLAPVLAYSEVIVFLSAWGIVISKKYVAYKQVQEKGVTPKPAPTRKAKGYADMLKGEM